MSFLEEEEARIRRRRKEKIAEIKEKQRKTEMKSPVAKIIRAGRKIEEGDPAVGKTVVGR